MVMLDPAAGARRAGARRAGPRCAGARPPGLRSVSTRSQMFIWRDVSTLMLREQ